MSSTTKKSKLKKPSLSTVKKSKAWKVVPQKFRAKEPLYSVFMWGVNHSISELRNVKTVMLMPDDYKAYSKVKKDNFHFNKYKRHCTFYMDYRFFRENMPSHFKVKEYCPLVFKHIREKFAIDDMDYLNSMTHGDPVKYEASGRSGAKFIFSCDQVYCIKMITSEDVVELHSILPDYYQYIVSCKGVTYLPHYCGLYRITVNDVESYMLVMKNVFSPRLPITRKYDLKGSTVDRSASLKEKAKRQPTLKDNDFVGGDETVRIGASAKAALMEQLTKDVDFLSSLNLMDFSLLVGIHDTGAAELSEPSGGEDDDVPSDDDQPGTGDECSDEELPPENDVNCSPFEGELDKVNLERFAVKSADDKIIYFMGLVDILTEYDMKKKSARAAKTVKYGTAAEISTVRPEQYAKRFIDFVEKCIE